MAQWSGCLANARPHIKRDGPSDRPRDRHANPAASSGGSATSWCPTRKPWRKWKRRIAAIREGTARELVWLLEHPPLYTAGTSARAQDLLDPARLPVHRTGRGGQYTYHGPGQRIAYVMLDLERWGRDVRCHVWRLEEWVIATLARFNITGERRDGRVGVWVAGRPEDRAGARTRSPRSACECAAG